ncbi:13375_t:CDS:1 [Entrophospora sp. SA101]|nr:13375_t:CDS:1 [Entrophospora sp. SA101]
MAISLNKKKALKDKERQSKKRKYKTLIKNQRKIIENECSRQSTLKKNETNFANLKKLFSQGQKIIDKAVQKGIIHKNNAARKKRKISQKVNELEKQINLGNSTLIEE